MSSRTWSAKTTVLTADKKLASVIVRLMMAMNDIALANEGLSEWTGTTDPRKVPTKWRPALLRPHADGAHLRGAKHHRGYTAGHQAEGRRAAMRSQDALLLRCRRSVLGDGRLRKCCCASETTPHSIMTASLRLGHWNKSTRVLQIIASRTRSAMTRRIGILS